MCTIAIEVNSQSFFNNYGQQNRGLNFSQRQNNRNTGIYFRNSDKDLSSYDKYINDKLNQNREEALANNNRIANDNINQINVVQSIQPNSDESPITTKPVRFVGVGKTDVEYLNNVTYAITNFGVNLMKVINIQKNIFKISKISNFCCFYFFIYRFNRPQKNMIKLQYPIKSICAIMILIVKYNSGVFCLNYRA